MTMRLSGVIFDLDGVIVHTSELHYQAWKRLADEQGAAFGRRQNEKFKGVSRLDCVQLLFPGLTEPERIRLTDVKNGYYIDLLASLGPADILPGIPDLVEALRAEGISIAIASVSKNTHIVVEKLKIAGKFDAIVDGTMVQNSKPAPDAFLLAAKKFKLPPASCLVIEDAAAGIQAAIAARMTAVGVGNTADLPDAHEVVSGPHELSVDRLNHIHERVTFS